MNLVRARIRCFVVSLAVMLWCSSALAEGISKEACVESHSRGQDARDQGRISVARKLFMTCAQSSCPALVQNDCARFADQLERVQPSLSFSARDDRGNDLPDTAVYVDDVLVVTRLDGKPHDVDPGKHVVRFEHGGREKVVTLVVGSGEKARAVVSTFQGAPGSSALEPTPAAAASEPSRPVGPKVAIVASATTLALGGTLGVIGLMSVPDECEVSSHECTAPPGDASFDDAKKAIRLSNIGWTVGGFGVAALAASLVWYVKAGTGEGEEPKTEISPYATSDSAGLVLTGRM